MTAHRSARRVALAALEQWRSGSRFADSIMQEMLASSDLRGADRGFVTELFYGVLRSLSLLDFWIAQLRSGPVDNRSRDLLRLGLYQLLCISVPSHAAVFETVALAPSRTRSLINGILRSASRRASELHESAGNTSLAIRTSHPQFLIDRWTEAFGTEAAEKLCGWNNAPPATYARINRLKTNIGDFLKAEATRESLPVHPNFVRLRNVPLEALEHGECYIQDPSTSVACELLDPQRGDTILDACAAPGGKTSYLGELMHNEGALVATDRDATRLGVLEGNLQRLGLTDARVIQQDWTADTIASEIRELRFDRILVDAPCSNTGVLRRRVDARWRLRPDEFSRMGAEQIAILRGVMRLLKPGGTLVYSTCSVEAEENSGVVAQALREFRGLRLAEERTVLPFRDGFDGAFAAKLVNDA